MVLLCYNVGVEKAMHPRVGSTGCVANIQAVKGVNVSMSNDSISVSQSQIITVQLNTKQIERLFRRIQLSTTEFYAGTPCWVWNGERDKDGYGRIEIKGVRTRGVHRIMYAWLVGSLPVGDKNLSSVVHHKCERTYCCNPVHLALVTQQVNVLVGNGITAKFARVTHCPSGHEYTPENTKVKKGSRSCRECARAYAAQRRLKEPEKLKANRIANYWKDIEKSRAKGREDARRRKQRIKDRKAQEECD